MTNTELFEDPILAAALQEPIDPSKDYRSELVGEGKKYKDDAALALAVVHANRHIERLEMEQKAMRTDMNSRLSLEELVTKLTSQKAPDPAPQGGDDHSSETSKNTLTAEDLARIVDERVNARTEAERAKANLGLVKDTLKQEWGSDYVNKMKSKAQELGVGENFLNSLAMEQPKAFLKLMEVGVKPKEASSPNTVAPVRGSQMSQITAQADPNFKGKSYYDKLRRETPAKFWDHKTQLEMNQVAMLDPEKFLAS